MSRLLSLLIGYCFGLFQTSYFYGKLHGVDIRTMGSGNAGTTNALRSLGAKAGLITLAGDVCKCILAVLVMYLLIGKNHPEILPLLKVYTAFGVILGHDFPFMRGFRGGKGVASLLGVVLTFKPLMVPALLVIFLALAVATGYVSLASMTAAACLAIESYIFAAAGLFRDTGSFLVETCILFTVIAALTIFQHRENIRRLRAGTENRFGHKKR